MSSTYSPTLRIELIGDGDQSGIWGQTTNNNLGSLLEQAITGVVTILMTDANYTLTSYNGVVDEARNAVIIATGTNSAQRNIVAPLVEKIYTVKNSTTGGYAVQIIGPSGTGVVIPNGVTASVYCDGTNFYNLQVGTTGNETINGNLVVTGTATIGGLLSGSTATFSGAISSVNPSFTGTPTAPTATTGTSTTQIATTAFVANTVTGLGLGTMATQNANNVAITGGAISGVTISSATISSLASALAVLYGGTGVTTSTGSGSNVLSASPTFTGVPIAPTASAGTNTTQIATTAFVTGAITTLGLGTMSTQNANNVNITGGTIGASVAWAAMPAGTRVMFAQSTAPTGWTQVTSDEANNRMLRVVSSAGAGTGGTASPILMDVVPSHTHTYSSTSGGQSQSHTHAVSGTSGSMNSNTTHTHGVTDPGHTHSLDNNCLYNTGVDNQLDGDSHHSSPYDGYITTRVTTSNTTGISINSANIDHTHNFSTTSGSASVDHTHAISGTTAANGSASNWTPRYIDMILCSKN